MDITKSLVLGIIEGLTEFLPISSTGHLIIASSLLKLSGPEIKAFNIVIQLGAISAICWVYIDKILSLAKGVGKNSADNKFCRNILIAFMPAALLGLMLHGTIKTYLFSPVTVASALILGGFIILLVERKYESPKISAIEEMTILDSLKIGLAQTLALFPGVSRAGATIVGGIWLGLSRENATKFSFFLAIPTMLGATIYETVSSWNILSTDNLPSFIFGFVAAFVTAMFTVKIFLRYVSNNNFKPFAWYRIIFGLIILLSWKMNFVDWQNL